MLLSHSSFTNILAYFIATAAIVFFVLPFHEYAHGYTAVKLGDPTPRYQGRLTLNPLAHIDPIGSICILLFGFGWARPVQINARYFKNPKRDMAITAAAGPISNLLAAFIATLLIYLSVLIGGADGSLILTNNFLLILLMIMRFFVTTNIYLAVFNLIPIPPLDGSRLLSAFLPDRIYYKLMQYERYIFYGVLLLIWIGVLDLPLNFLANGVLAGYKGLFGSIFPERVSGFVTFYIL